MIEDVLNNETELITVSVGEPLFFIDTKLKSVSVGKFPEFPNCLEVKGDLIVNGVNINDMLNSQEGLEIEAIAGTPYIDFKNDSTIDYDARIVLTEDDKLEVLGADLHVQNIVSPAFSSTNVDGGYTDEYFNIKAKANVISTAIWHLNNSLGNMFCESLAEFLKINESI